MQSKTLRTPAGAALVALAAAFFAGTAAASPLDLTAAHSSDATEATAGVFVPANGVVASLASFGHQRYLMRPVTLSGAFPGSTVTLSASTNGVLEVYDKSGTLIPLPATFAAASLPVTLLVSGRTEGAAKLGVTDGFSRDLVLFRVGCFPGLAGRSLSQTPYFEFVRAINHDSVLEAALDPVRHPDRIGHKFHLYVVAHKSPSQWALDPTLTDVTDDGHDVEELVAGSVADNTWTAWTTGLAGDGGQALGIAYDVVLDYGGDGKLDPGDLIDGLGSDGSDPFEAGIYLVDDTAALGPLAFASFDFDDPNLFTVPPYHGEPAYTADSRGRVVYPVPLPEGPLPLVTFSHGNTFEPLSYQGYTYLQEMLASHGIVTASFDMFPAHGRGFDLDDPFHRAWLTLKNTERMLLQSGAPRFYPPLGGGVLEPGGVSAISGKRVVLSGHSRGGEAVVLASSILRHLYDPLYTFPGSTPPGETIYGFNEVRGLHDIAGTNFNLESDGNSPWDTPYLLYWSSADRDVTGQFPDTQPSRRYGRAFGDKAFLYLYGGQHGCWNQLWSYDCFVGFGLLLQSEVEIASAGYLQPWVQRLVRDNVPATDFFTRGPSVFRPIGAQALPPELPIVVRWRDAEAAGHFVIDDYETNPSTAVSSSGGVVTSTLDLVEEGMLSWWESEEANLEWSGASQRYELEVIAAERDLRDDLYLSFNFARAEPFATTPGNVNFDVSLVDAFGIVATLNSKEYGPVDYHHGIGGLEHRSALETYRLRLCDFETAQPKLDLGNVVAVRFELGTDHGSTLDGELVLDDVEIIRAP